MNSFSGKILEIPEVYVDNFEDASTCRATAYFLSHYHKDHIYGLDFAEFKNKLQEKKNIYIYANELTATIVKFEDKYLRKYVKVLEMGVNTVKIPKVDSENNEDFLNITVTLIPAGHCLGSTMFLFETSSARVLYTGDFRISPNDLSKYAAFHDQNGQVIKLDALIVDTTFNSIEYEHFPKRSESVEEAVDLIKTWLAEDMHVILETSASYGYEYIFNEIYKVLNKKVLVNEKKIKIYSAMPDLALGVTNNPDDTRIYEKFELPERLSDIQNKKIIHFSARIWKNWNKEQSSIKTTGAKTMVCFATHCSNSELVSFVEYLKPARVEGFKEPYVPRRRVDLNSMVTTLGSPRKSPLNSPEKSHPNDRKV